MATTVRERPILFSGPMVRAIFAGRKTQTRRVVDPQPQPNGGAGFVPIEPYRTPNNTWNWVIAATGHGCRDPFPCPYGVPSDRLWVREAWARGHSLTPASGDRVIYRAEGEVEDSSSRGPWRPSIFMPRWASRLTLEVVSVRVERLQEIGEQDAQSEGVDVAQRAAAPGDERRRCVHCGKHKNEHVGSANVCFGSNGELYSNRTYRGGFAGLWDSINGKRAPWVSNPWVWVVEFRKLALPGSASP